MNYESHWKVSFIEAFNALSADQHKRMRSQGFWDASDAVIAAADAAGCGTDARKMRAAQLNALVAGEIGEALEGIRKDLPSDKIEGFTNEEEEYADAIIRILDLNTARNLRIGEAVVAKMEHNLTRAHRHGGKSF